MRFLRQNTAVIVTVGPFYDKTDGVTIETGLTITNERITLTADTDDGSAPTNILDNVTGATSGTSNDLNYITGNDAGMMQLELSAANTNRVGRVLLSITDAANHVPVFHEFFILPQAIYDWFAGVIVPLPANVTTIAGSAVSTSSAQLGVNVVNWKGSAAAAMTGDAFARLGAPAGASVSADVAAVKSDSAAILADTGTDGVVVAAGSKTGYSLTATTGLGNQTANITGNLSGSVGSVTGAVGSVTGAVGSVTGAVGSVTGNVGGNVTGSVGSVVGHTAQTGDTFALANGVNGFVALKGVVDTIQADTDLLDDAVGGLADIHTDVAAVKSDTAAILADTGTDGVVVAASSKTGYTLTATTGLGNQTANITGNLSGSVGSVTGAVGSVTGHTPQTGDSFAIVNGASGLVAIKGDTAAILTDTGTTLDGKVDAILADTGTDGVVVAAGSKTGYALSSAGIDAVWDQASSLTISFETLLTRTYQMISNKMNVTDADGTVALRNIGDTGTIATGSVTDDSTTTTRAELTWA